MPTAVPPPPGRRPACLAAAAFAGGLVFAVLYAPPLWPLIIGAAVLAGAALAFHRRPAATVLVLAALAAAGASWYLARRDYLPADDVSFSLRPRFAPEEVTVRGVVASDPDRRPHGTVFSLQLDSVNREGAAEPASGRARVTVYDNVALRYGDAVAIAGKLASPKPARNPNGFDYRAYLQRRGMTAVLTAATVADVTVLGGGRGHPLLAASYAIRNEAARILERSVGGEEEAAVLKGLTLGKRAEIDAALVEQFRGAGATHLLAISGLHVGFVAFVLFLVLSGTRVPRPAAALVVMAFLPAYALLTGFNPPVVRAALMGILVLAAGLLDRDVDLLNLLAAAALILLIYNPLYIADVSFLLSFAAVFAIALLYRPILRFLGKTPRLLRESLAVTAAAQLGVLPLQIYFFHHFTPTALISNLVMVPLAAVNVALALTTIVTGAIWPALGELYGGASWLAAKALMEAGRLFAGGLAPLAEAWPGRAGVPGLASLLRLQFWVAQPSPLLLLAVVAALGALAVRRWRPRLALGAASVTFLTWWLVPKVVSPPLPLRFTFVDVGQADCTLVEFPNGERMMVDAGYAGGTYDAGERVIAPLLRSRGINRLDYLCVTHGDADHAGGASYLVRNFDVREVWLPAGEDDRPPLRALREAMAERAVKAGTPPTKVEIGGVRLARLWPPPGRPPRGFSANNASTVLRLSYGDFASLLTGDVEQPAQERIVERGGELRADLLKVPHHGAAGAAYVPFVAAVNPRLTLFPTKSGAPKFPAAATLALYRAAGASCLAAGENGAAVAKTDGRRLRVRTMF